ncbi:MAG: hypothetical protein AAB372_02455 [Patescibacteria group bacterium]
MNQTNKQNSKRDKSEEETLILLDIAKAIEEVKVDGYGSVTIFIQDKRIYRWEILKSRTKGRSGHAHSSPESVA